MFITTLEVHIKKMEKFDDYRNSDFLVIKEWKQEVQKLNNKKFNF